MAVYIVAYDLNNEVRRPKIVDAIKAYETWAMLSESSYAIVTELDPSSVYADIGQLIDADDALYVVTLSAPLQGYGPQAVVDWLNEHLT